MATPLGREGLVALLEKSCRIVLANETGGATIAAAAFVLHHEDGATEPLAFYGLGVGPGVSASFDHDRPSPSPVVLVEALLRVHVDDPTAVVDVYATAAADPPRALRAVTFGIKANDHVLEPGESLVPGAPQLALFGRAAG
jgi:hypothetical protein